MSRSKRVDEWNMSAKRVRYTNAGSSTHWNFEPRQGVIECAQEIPCMRLGCARRAGGRCQACDGRGAATRQQHNDHPTIESHAAKQRSCVRPSLGRPYNASSKQARLRHAGRKPRVSVYKRAQGTNGIDSSSVGHRGVIAVPMCPSITSFDTPLSPDLLLVGDLGLSIIQAAVNGQITL